ncbi:MAG: CinA family protein [Planctomycetaceae bacterium]|nr:CinA family protein [Planctomycetaceae bacterium]MCB9939995.1 CinA family protein [Planctomycetaceae bacterium]HRX80247.1 CinA family protein [Pirellulaceae bacterium]
MTQLTKDAQRLAGLLSKSSVRIVFAESCTGGLVAASLAKVPGISDYLCGSAVTYRNATKHAWLAVSDEKLTRPGPVSAVVASEMAAGVLAMTPEADWSASVTGHLGPNAPKRLDGLVYIGIGRRVGKLVESSASRHVLTSETRLTRQKEAASLVLDKLFEAICDWQDE